eukprot:TRINITY_DN67868_c4_g1_i2.p1 TRINITY_DN67868_c4_g1~~TRINITY_DN67868_c4_g1_i2.p1  ORF type:complete len:152 (-),score=21.21 TRINITY_DN67868_c4_g1_i2:236-691(-)
MITREAACDPEPLHPVRRLTDEEETDHVSRLYEQAVSDLEEHRENLESKFLEEVTPSHAFDSVEDLEESVHRLYYVEKQKRDANVQIRREKYLVKPPKSKTINSPQLVASVQRLYYDEKEKRSNTKQRLQKEYVDDIVLFKPNLKKVRRKT